MLWANRSEEAARPQWIDEEPVEGKRAFSLWDDNFAFFRSNSWTRSWSPGSVLLGSHPSRITGAGVEAGKLLVVDCNQLILPVFAPSDVVGWLVPWQVAFSPPTDVPHDSNDPDDPLAAGCPPGTLGSLVNVGLCDPVTRGAENVELSNSRSQSNLNCPTKNA